MTGARPGARRAACPDVRAATGPDAARNRRGGGAHVHRQPVAPCKRQQRPWLPPQSGGAAQSRRSRPIAALTRCRDSSTSRRAELRRGATGRRTTRAPGRVAKRSRGPRVAGSPSRPGRRRAVGVHGQCRGTPPRVPRRQVSPAEQLQQCQPRGGAAVIHPDGQHTERSRAQARTPGAVPQAPEPVGVVGHQQRVGTGMLRAVRRPEAQRQRRRVGPDQAGQFVQDRPHLGAPVMP